MPAKRKPLWIFEKSSQFSIQDIENVLFDIDEGSFSGNDMPFIYTNQMSCHIKEENGRFIVHFHDGHKEFVTVDTTNHQLTIQGEWWYKGVYTLSQENNHTNISSQVFNVARKGRWMASLMALFEKTTHEKNFHVFVERIEAAIKRRK
ncbi:hypothetical protein [Emticicia agri]|uniref:SRPBCC family protein n=1 Tax=Emticicia agri TaxID=2492393 RepID=A0A4Q5M4M0_9BACT|nr:hypothetical protein [Emticicia agri]RYU97416.1 hypothetical protein EWM59_01630 [Emticicia agri]